MSVYGIDLGTTNSCISVFENGHAKVIPIDEQQTVPSVVAWNGREYLVGHSARNWGFLKPSQVVRSIKRKMGQAEYRVQLGDKSFDPVDISSKILEYLAKQAGAVTQQEVQDVVITVPAWFGDEQRRATLAAGQRAGLNVLRIINEPTAAALSYQAVGSSWTQPSHEEEVWLVYDLGGGTFDVSILKVKGEYKEVLTSTGNTFLGGDDFDRMFAQKIAARIKDQYGLNPEDDDIALATLRFIAEEGKIRLSQEAEIRINRKLELGGQTISLDLQFTRKEFEDLVEDLIDSTLDKVRQALADADLQVQDLDRLILVGGSSRIPLVQEKLRDFLHLNPELYVDPDLSVSLGACLQAALVKGLSYEQTVVDICPHTLGIAAHGQHDLMSEREAEDYPLSFSPLILRNSRLPAKITQTFFKGFLEQNLVEIVVLQGESALSHENTLIGKFRAALRPSDRLEVYVRFAYDANGIIEVGVSQNHDQDLVKTYKMDSHQSATWNSELVVESDDDQTDPQSDINVSNYLIEQVHVQLDRVSPEEREQIREQLSRYRQALASMNDSLMDELEGDLYLWLEKKKAEEGGSLGAQ